MVTLFWSVNEARSYRFIVVLKRLPASYNLKAIKEPISNHVWLDQNTNLHDPPAMQKTEIMTHYITPIQHTKIHRGYNNAY